MHRITVLILGVTGASCAHSFNRTFEGTGARGDRSAGGELVVEYGRGTSLPTVGDLRVRWAGDDLTLHHVHLDGHSFFPDNSPIPNAFIARWVRGDVVEAVKAFTEPYYGARAFYFLSRYPNWGVGVEFLHLKVFVTDYQQRIRVSGERSGARVDELGPVSDYVHHFNVSHGVNCLSLVWVFRLTRMPGETNVRRLQPFVSVALGPAFPHLEVELRDRDGEKVRMAYSHKSGIENYGLGLALGARYRFSRHVGVYLEYKLTYAHLHDMHFDDNRDGEAGASFASEQIQWGISFIL